MCDTPFAKRLFRGRLWGYPDLVKALFEIVGPALVEEHEKSRREREEAEKRRMITEHVNNVPDVVGEDMNDTDPDPSQSNEPTFLDDRSGVPDISQTVAQLDSQGLPDNHPPTTDEHPLQTAASAITEALEPRSGAVVLQSNIEEEDGTPSDIAGVPSPWETDSERSRIVQDKEGLKE